MSIVNVLRVAFNDGGVTWRNVPASVAQFGRVEGTASFRVASLDAAQRLGDLFLASRAWPDESHVFRLAESPGQQFGVDVNVGDTATVAGVSRRLVEVRWDLDPFGKMQATSPGFESPIRAQRAADDAKIAQIIAAEGSAASGSARVELGPGAITGKLEPKRLEAWSTWDDDDFEDGEVWQSAPVDEPVRISRIVAMSGDNSDVDGTTRVRLLINGVEANASAAFGGIPTDVVLGPSDWASDVEVHGHTVLGKGSTFGLKLVSWGGHKRCSWTVFGADPL